MNHFYIVARQMHFFIITYRRAFPNVWSSFSNSNDAAVSVEPGSWVQLEHVRSSCCDCLMPQLTTRMRCFSGCTSPSTAPSTAPTGCAPAVASSISVSDMLQYVSLFYSTRTRLVKRRCSKRNAFSNRLSYRRISQELHPVQVRAPGLNNDVDR